MTKYVEYLNHLIKTEVAKPKHVVLFGQNINAGSCLGGLTRGMKVQAGSRIINSTNTENSLVGFGFGLMMNGAQSVFFMKQLDFLLLGVDQLVNTYNIIRSIKHQPKEGSFTIVATVVDSGYEGPQSSLNNFSDFCSIARVPGFAVTNKVDADYIFLRHLIQPGFRIIGVGQRLGKTEIVDPERFHWAAEDGSIFHYIKGKDATLVSFNFSFPKAFKLQKTLKERGIDCDCFNVNSAIAIDWTMIRESVFKTRKIIVVDDSKSAHIPAESLLADLAPMLLQRKIVLRRKLGENWLYPVSDVFEIDEEDVLHQLTHSVERDL